MKYINSPKDVAVRIIMAKWGLLAMHCDSDNEIISREIVEAVKKAKDSFNDENVND